jgi:hypothetical protein
MSGPFETSDGFEERLQSARGGGQPLSGDVRGFMEPRFGADFSDVRLHTGKDADDLNQSVSAQAFTLGQDIYLGEGKDNVESSEGKHLLAHELTHVVQQNGNAGRRKTSGLRLIQRLSSKPKTSEKILKKLTRNLEKAVRNGGNAKPPADAIFQQNTDYYLKLFRYKFEKHKGSDETKFKAYKAVFKMEAIMEAWNQRGQFRDVIEEMCKLVPFIPDNADQMATEDAAFFLRYILVPLKEISDQASSF